MLLGGTPKNHRQELRQQRIVCAADGSVVCRVNSLKNKIKMKEVIKVVLLDELKATLLAYEEPLKDLRDSL